MIGEGDSIPDIAMATPDGGSVKPSDYAGKAWVLYFYPKADTPGCTTEALDFSTLKGDFDKIGVPILGVSNDPPKKHAKFIDKHGLIVPLAADEGLEMSEALGIWVEKQMYGKTYMGLERTTYLVGRDGKVAQVWRKVKVKGHAAEVLEAAKGVV